MTRLLVSVRDAAEALAAADAGADLIDLKDPAAGALGALAPERIVAIVAALRRDHPAMPISATTGDWPAAQRARIVDAVHAVAACGVDYVKVGIDPLPDGVKLLDVLAATGVPIVPVLIADRGVERAVLAAALALPGFPALMLDLADKRGGSLVERVPRAELRGFVASVRQRHRLAGLAGALRAEDVPSVLALAPDIAGFRSAVCAGDRAGSLDARRVRALRARFLPTSPRDAAVPAR
jgi:uncharacterized protein (UPF0264 family)